MTRKYYTDLEIEKWDSNEMKILENDKDLKILENKFNKFVKNRNHQNSNIENSVKDIQVTDVLQRKMNSLYNLI